MTSPFPGGADRWQRRGPPGADRHRRRHHHHGRVVFSITILALTLASQQFGPRMMRNFIRDLGNQMTLGSSLRPSCTRPRPRFDLHVAGRRLRPAPHDHHGRGAATGRLGSARVLHPPHRQVHPAPRGHRRIARDLDRPSTSNFHAGSRSTTERAPAHRRAGDLALALSERGADVMANKSGYLQRSATNS